MSFNINMCLIFARKQTYLLQIQRNEIGKKSEDLGKTVDGERYQIFVGKLSHTKPNITLAVNIVNQHIHSLEEAHIEAIYRSFSNISWIGKK